MIVDATNNNAESHRDKNCHNKNRGQQLVKELNSEHLKPDLESKNKRIRKARGITINTIERK